MYTNFVYKAQKVFVLLYYLFVLFLLLCLSVRYSLFVCYLFVCAVFSLFVLLCLLFYFCAPALCDVQCGALITHSDKVSTMLQTERQKIKV